MEAKINNNKIIPNKSIIVSHNAAIGRLGNYMYNNAICTRVLFELNKKYSDFNKYLYFYCERDVPDGHGNDNAYSYKDTVDSYHLSILKYDPIDKNDKIFSITCHHENINLETCERTETVSKMCEQLEKEGRLLWAKDADKYELFIDAFPIIIEVLQFGKCLMVYVNNCVYEGIEYINAMYKNLYPLNDNIVTQIMKILPGILAKYTEASYLFIKLNFVILSTYLNFHSDEFSVYFTKKLFGYKINENQTAMDFVKNIYNNAVNRIKKDNKKTYFVSMHFRGGDYGDPTKDAGSFAVIGPQYYKDCINEISKKHKNVIFIMFCAPVDLTFVNNTFVPYLCKSTGKKIISHDTFLGEDGNLINTQLNIYLMGLFDNMCISNSTYSWWSAYFSHNFNNRNQIYVPMLYKFPTDSNMYSYYDHAYVLNKNIIKLNNHVGNAIVFYGFSSSIYIYILLKRYLRQIVTHIYQMNLDLNLFKQFITLVLKKCKKDTAIESYDEINKLIEIIREMKEPVDKCKLRDIISELYQHLFTKQTKKFLLEFADTKSRFVMIKIDELFCTTDRSPKHYKEIEDITQATVNIASIDNEVYKYIVSVMQ